ncbi:MAG: NAD-glutamate dehydrogenase [Desulfobacterales bacterium]|nr:NAD-glutamate dehydrogenase [Desulfobacterales bacterium]
MDTKTDAGLSVTKGAYIIQKAQTVKLNSSLLYEAVIDLSSEGLITANCINMAAGILLDDLGLPDYFFETITKESLKSILSSIAKSIKFDDDKVVIDSWVADIDCDLTQGQQVQRVRIATKDNRERMERVLDTMLSGHRREYYYNPDSEYYTYVFRQETVADFDPSQFSDSRFLFNMDQDYTVTPRLTRQRYEKFLAAVSDNVTPLVEVFNLSDIGEIRFMFNSDFERPQLQVLRRMFQDHGLVITRAYWEPYYVDSKVTSSICSLYVQGELSRAKEAEILEDLRAYLSFSVSPITQLYVDGQINFREMLFAGNAVDFTHMFIFKERNTKADMDLLNSLDSANHKEAFSSRVQESNKFTYVHRTVLETAKSHPDLLRFLYDLFDRRFNPDTPNDLGLEELARKEDEFIKMLEIRFMDYPIGFDIFKYMFKILTATLKTNFYKTEKRSFSFRLDNRILDPLVFKQFVYGIFYVNGHYACGTHLRADDIARGGLRMLRITKGNHSMELDNAVLLNYALGPRAQRLKHKDICESGSKGVVVPHALYAAYSMDALYDYTEGIMDLMLVDESVVDHYGKPEMIFFGPDEGTAPLMDAISFRAKERGYQYWRTMTTGKSFGIPHDTYGILENGDLFGLIPHGPEQGTELQINGKTVTVTTNMDEIHAKVGGKIEISGMTTTSVMGAFRTLIAHHKAKESDLNLMMTGGPDGDLGSNEIQCYKGKICLIIDGGSILFDPDGLDREELMKIAFMRHTAPRANSMSFPEGKIGPRGFRVPLRGKDITLPDGTHIEDGAIFHRNFITDPANRKYIEQANIQAFIPCGGFKDTINQSNITDFLDNFQELRFIVEGANVFFDDAARRHIAGETPIYQIKDSSANKGGVFSSSVAEVLTAFLFENDYEARLLEDAETRWALIRDIMTLVSTFAGMETQMLIDVHEVDKKTPLFVLSETTSEQIFAFQAKVEENLEAIVADTDLMLKILDAYVPPVCMKSLGAENVLDIMNSDKLHAYRNAIVTKKLASLAFYQNAGNWDKYVKAAEKKFIPAMHAIFDTK